MGSIDGIDDRTFSSNFTGDGIQKLRDEVEEKLKEFMGEYTDDALVVCKTLAHSHDWIDNSEIRLCFVVERMCLP